MRGRIKKEKSSACLSANLHTILPTCQPAYLPACLPAGLWFSEFFFKVAFAASSFPRQNERFATSNHSTWMAESELRSDWLLDMKALQTMHPTIHPTNQPTRAWPTSDFHPHLPPPASFLAPLLIIPVFSLITPAQKTFFIFYFKKLNDSFLKIKKRKILLLSRMIITLTLMVTSVCNST